MLLLTALGRGARYNVHCMASLVLCYDLLQTSVSETIRKPPLVNAQTALKAKKYGVTIFNMADRIITPCNVARLWHWFRQVTAPCNVACGSGIMTVTVNSPSGSTLECDAWLSDDMPLNSPVAAPCDVTRISGIMTLNSPGGSTLHRGRWPWGDMPWNSPKRPLYWNSTSGFDFDRITAVDMSFCTSLRNFIQMGPPWAEKSDVMSILKMVDLSHLGF